MVRVGVLGAGGVGSTLAAMVHRADPAAATVLIGRPGPHLDRVAAHGLRVRPAGGTEWICHLDARPAAAVPPASLDVLVLLTKTYDGAGAVRGAAHLLAPGGVAVSLQNGLGNDVVLATEFGGARALVGVTTIGAARQDPGTVSVAAGTAAGRSLTHVGPLGAARGPAALAERVAARLSAAGLPCAAVADAAEQVWGKLALAVMSPVSAVLGLPVGAVWAQPDGRELVRAMFDETVAVAAVDGVALDRDAAWEHAAATFEHTGAHRTSMCDDVLAGRPTELEAMAGAVERRGRDHGLALPVHTAVLGLLRTRIGAGRGPAGPRA